MLANKTQSAHRICWIPGRGRNCSITDEIEPAGSPQVFTGFLFCRSFTVNWDRVIPHGTGTPQLITAGEASSSAPGGETVLGRRRRGWEAFDDEAPTVMAEGDEASSSAQPTKRPRGKKGGRKAKMGADQVSDGRGREKEGV